MSIRLILTSTRYCVHMIIYKEDILQRNELLTRTIKKKKNINNFDIYFKSSWLIYFMN